MTTTGNRHPVSIEADPHLPIIRMPRDFDATPAELMRAHTDPALFARWVGPNGMETEILDWDASTGGRWRYVARRDGMEFGFVLRRSLVALAPEVAASRFRAAYSQWAGQRRARHPRRHPIGPS